MTDPYAPASKTTIRSPTAGAGRRRSLPSVSVVSQIGPTKSIRASGPVAGDDRLDAVVGAVEHRPHQLGHAGIDDDEQLASGLRLDVDDPGDEQTGLADQKTAGLENQREPGLAHDRQHRRGVLRGGRHPLAFVRDAESAADVEVLDLETRAAQVGGKGRQRPAPARWSGSSSVICEPTWLCSPTISTPRRPCMRRHIAACVVDGDPELVVLAGRSRCAGGCGRRCRG